MPVLEFHKHVEILQINGLIFKKRISKIGCNSDWDKLTQQCIIMQKRKLLEVGNSRKWWYL